MRYIELFEDKNEKLMLWFGNSKVVDKHGDPMVMYHGTKENFDTFLPWSHFGTARAANDRIKYVQAQTLGRPGAARRYKPQEERIIPVYLHIENPLRVEDKDTNDEATLLNSFIRNEILMPTGFRLDIDYARKHGTMAALTKLGYDGLVYKNRFEDQGKDSWIIFRPEQAKSIFDF